MQTDEDEGSAQTPTAESLTEMKMLTQGKAKA